MAESVVEAGTLHAKLLGKPGNAATLAFQFIIDALAYAQVVDGQIQALVFVKLLNGLVFLRGRNVGKGEICFLCEKDRVEVVFEMSCSIFMSCLLCFISEIRREAYFDSLLISMPHETARHKNTWSLFSIFVSWVSPNTLLQIEK